MTFMQRTFTSVAAMGALCAPAPAPSSSNDPKIAYMSSQPENAVSSADMGIRLFSFGTKAKDRKGDVITTYSQGLYDEIVGVACSMTSERHDLSHQVTTAPTVMVRHECREMPQPEKWQRANAPEMGVAGERGRAMVVDGDSEVRNQYTIVVGPTGVNFFSRHWFKATRTVCLGMGTLEPSSGGIAISSFMNNGCYKMEDREFFIKREIATSQVRYEA